MAYNTLSRSDCNISSHAVKVGIVTSFTGTSRKQMELPQNTIVYRMNVKSCKFVISEVS